MRVFFSAGEASGDALGAALIEALKAKDPALEAYGMGGPRMAAAGCRVEQDAAELNVMGLVEVLRHLPRLFRLRDRVVQLALQNRPDVAVLIDVPDFNVRVAKQLKAAGIKVAFYVGPSVWAWRPGRVERYRRVLDRLLVLFPFEAPIWARAGVDVVCVGHPMLDEIPAPAAGALIRPKTVALLPGSRRGEIQRHFPLMLAAAQRLLQRGLAERFVVPVAPTVDVEWLRGFVARAGLSERVELVEDRDGPLRRAAVASSELALVVSGTATLETALLGRPQIIFYRANWLSYWVYRLMVTLTHVGLPNIIAGREVAPELLQGKLTAESLAAAAAQLLGDPAAKAAAVQATAEIRDRLGPPGGAARAAAAVLALAERAG